MADKDASTNVDNNNNKENSDKRMKIVPHEYILDPI